MRIIFGFIWSFLISCMVLYVIGNMSGTPFDVKTAAALAIVFTIVIAVLGEGILKDDEAA